MERMVFDLDSMPKGDRSDTRSPIRTCDTLLMAGACLIAVITLVVVLLRLAQRPQPGVVQRAYVLPTPEALTPPQLVLPSVTVTMPPPAQIVQIPPQRRSVWEIRAELKRGLGEWEFPHYVNAPHYGSGPASPLPSQLSPLVATASAD